MNNSLGILRPGLIAGALLAAPFLSAQVSPIVLTEIADGNYNFANPSMDPVGTAQQQPKFIEIANIGGSTYNFGVGSGLIIQSNSATDYNVDLSLEGLSLAPGQVYVMVSVTPGAGETIDNVSGKLIGQLAFESIFGTGKADLYSTTVSFGNGDDRVMIYDGSTVLDTYGVDGVDGTGSSWEYTDGYAQRTVFGAGSGLGFNQAEWLSVNGGLVDGLAATAMSALSPGVIPEPSSLGLLFGLGAIGGVLRRRTRG